MAIHSSTLAWKIPWTEKPGWLQSMGLQSPTQLSNFTFPFLSIFQVSMQFCIVQHRTLLLSPVTSTTGCCFCFGSVSSFFLKLFLYWSPVEIILGTYWPGEFIFQCSIFLPFHTVNGVLKGRILKWFAIPYSSGPHFVRALHHDPCIMGDPVGHGS